MATKSITTTYILAHRMLNAMTPGGMSLEDRDKVFFENTVTVYGSLGIHPHRHYIEIRGDAAVIDGMLAEHKAILLSEEIKVINKQPQGTEVWTVL